MKIVLDTNVFVAALATHGLCQAVMELCLDQHEIAVSKAMLHEIRRNLIKKVKLPEQTADEVAAFIRSKTTLVSPSEVDQTACRDSDDLKVLGTAMAFGADYLVTGDQDMLVLGRFHRTRILTPSSFARILRERGKESGKYSRQAT